MPRDVRTGRHLAVPPRLSLARVSRRTVIPRGRAGRRRPSEALLELSDEQLEVPVSEAKPATGRVAISWPTSSPGSCWRSTSPRSWPLARARRRRPASRPIGTLGEGTFSHAEIQAEWAARRWPTSATSSAGWRRAARLPDGGPGIPLDQERGSPTHLRGGHAGSLRGAPPRPRGHPCRRGPVTDGPAGGGIGALIEATAIGFAAVDRQAVGGVVEWSTGGIVFAAVNGDRAEFRLALPVVGAALRTPDTTASDRGPDWVAFAPQQLDDHAGDRAVAWLASAWRRATAEG